MEEQEEDRAPGEEVAEARPGSDAGGPTATSGPSNPGERQHTYIPWTPEEDEQLRQLVAEHGAGKWNNIAQHFPPHRNAKSCRLRWVNQLRGDLKRGAFTEEEDNMILKAQAEHGNRWTVIARLLPGRTDNAVKNRWNSALKKRADQMADLQRQLENAAQLAESTGQPEAAGMLRTLARSMVTDPSIGKEVTNIMGMGMANPQSASITPPGVAPSAGAAAAAAGTAAPAQVGAEGSGGGAALPAAGAGTSAASAGAALQGLLLPVVPHAIGSALSHPVFSALQRLVATPGVAAAAAAAAAKPGRTRARETASSAAEEEDEDQEGGDEEDEEGKEEGGAQGRGAAGAGASGSTPRLKPDPEAQPFQAPGPLIGEGRAGSGDGTGRDTSAGRTRRRSAGTRSATPGATAALGRVRGSTAAASSTSAAGAAAGRGPRSTSRAGRAAAAAAAAAQEAAAGGAVTGLDAPASAAPSTQPARIAGLDLKQEAQEAQAAEGASRAAGLALGVPEGAAHSQPGFAPHAIALGGQSLPLPAAGVPPSSAHLAVLMVQHHQALARAGGGAPGPAILQAQLATLAAAQMLSAASGAAGSTGSATAASASQRSGQPPRAPSRGGAVTPASAFAPSSTAGEGAPQGLAALPSASATSAAAGGGSVAAGMHPVARTGPHEAFAGGLSSGLSPTAFTLSRPGGTSRPLVLTPIPPGASFGSQPGAEQGQLHQQGTLGSSSMMPGERAAAPRGSGPGCDTGVQAMEVGGSGRDAGHYQRHLQETAAGNVGQYPHPSSSGGAGEGAGLGRPQGGSTGAGAGAGPSPPPTSAHPHATSTTTATTSRAMTRADLPPELQNLSSEQLMKLAYIKHMYSKSKAQGQSQSAAGGGSAAGGAGGVQQPGQSAVSSRPVATEGYSESSSYQRQQHQHQQQQPMLQLPEQQQQQPQQATWAARPPPEDAKRVRLTLGTTTTTTSDSDKAGGSAGQTSNPTASDPGPPRQPPHTSVATRDLGGPQHMEGVEMMPEKKPERRASSTGTAQAAAAAAAKQGTSEHRRRPKSKSLSSESISIGGDVMPLGEPARSTGEEPINPEVVPLEAFAADTAAPPQVVKAGALESAAGKITAADMEGGPNITAEQQEQLLSTFKQYMASVPLPPPATHAPTLGPVPTAMNLPAGLLAAAGGLAGAPLVSPGSRLPGILRAPPGGAGPQVPGMPALPLAPGMQLPASAPIALALAAGQMGGLGPLSGPVAPPSVRDFLMAQAQQQQQQVLQQLLLGLAGGASGGPLGLAGGGAAGAGLGGLSLGSLAMIPPSYSQAPAYSSDPGGTAAVGAPGGGDGSAAASLAAQGPGSGSGRPAGAGTGTGVAPTGGSGAAAGAHHSRSSSAPVALQLGSSSLVTSAGPPPFSTSATHQGGLPATSQGALALPTTAPAPMAVPAASGARGAGTGTPSMVTEGGAQQGHTPTSFTATGAAAPPQDLTLLSQLAAVGLQTLLAAGGGASLAAQLAAAGAGGGQLASLQHLLQGQVGAGGGVAQLLQSPASHAHLQQALQQRLLGIPPSPSPLQHALQQQQQQQQRHYMPSLPFQQQFPVPVSPLGRAPSINQPDSSADAALRQQQAAQAAMLQELLQRVAAQQQAQEQQQQQPQQQQQQQQQEVEPEALEPQSSGYYTSAGSSMRTGPAAAAGRRQAAASSRQQQQQRPPRPESRQQQGAAGAITAGGGQGAEQAMGVEGDVMIGDAPQGMAPDSPPLLRMGRSGPMTAAAAAAAFARLPTDDSAVAALAAFGGNGGPGLAGLSPLQPPALQPLHQSGQQLAYQAGSGMFLPQAYSINLGDVDIAMLGRSNTITPLGSFGDLSSLLQSTAPLLASDLQALVSRSSPLTHRFSQQQLPLLQGPSGVLGAAVQAPHPGYGESPVPMDTSAWQQQQRVHRITSDTGQGPLVGQQQRMGSLQQSMSSWGQQQMLQPPALQGSLPGPLPAPDASGLISERISDQPFGAAGAPANLQAGAAWFPGGGAAMQRLDSLHSQTQQQRDQRQQQQPQVGGGGGYFGGHGGGVGPGTMGPDRLATGMQGDATVFGPAPAWPRAPGAVMMGPGATVIGPQGDAGAGPFFGGVPSGMAGGFGARRESHASGSDRPLFGGYGGGVPALGAPMFGQPSSAHQPQQQQPPQHFGHCGMAGVQPGAEPAAGTSHLAALSDQPQHQQQRAGGPAVLSLGSAGALMARGSLGDGSLGNLAGASPPGPPGFGLPQSPSVLLLQGMFGGEGMDSPVGGYPLGPNPLGLGPRPLHGSTDTFNQVNAMLGMPGNDSHSGGSGHSAGPQAPRPPAGQVLLQQLAVDPRGSEVAGSGREGGRGPGQPAGVATASGQGQEQLQQQASERGGGAMAGGQLPDIGCTEELLLRGTSTGRDGAAGHAVLPEGGNRRGNVGAGTTIAGADGGDGGNDESPEGGCVVPGAGGTSGGPSSGAGHHESDVQLIRRTSSAFPAGGAAGASQMVSNTRAAVGGQLRGAASQGDFNNKRRRADSL